MILYNIYKEKGDVMKKQLSKTVKKLKKTSSNVTKKVKKLSNASVKAVAGSLPLVPVLAVVATGSMLAPVATFAVAAGLIVGSAALALASKAK